MYSLSKIKWNIWNNVVAFKTTERWKKNISLFTLTTFNVTSEHLSSHQSAFCLIQMIIFLYFFCFFIQVTMTTLLLLCMSFPIILGMSLQHDEGKRSLCKVKKKAVVFIMYVMSKFMGEMLMGPLTRRIYILNDFWNDDERTCLKTFYNLYLVLKIILLCNLFL